MIVAEAETDRRDHRAGQGLRQHSGPGLQRVRDGLRGRRQEGGRRCSASALRMRFLQQGREVNDRRDHPGAPVRSRIPGGDSATVIDPYEAVVSLACGVGVQFTAEQLPDQRRCYPGVNTLLHGGDPGAAGSGPSAARAAAAASSATHRRHLPGGPLRQAPLQRPLRRLHAPASARSTRTWTAPGS
ncbi:MAG: hypothetical protein MZU91_08115 [Desulfosudis oleivorans]|nr:hypothetical protein [Desulfosudis oleivorans]